jgi:hypothetical protein
MVEPSNDQRIQTGDFLISERLSHPKLVNTGWLFLEEKMGKKISKINSLTYS